MGPDSGLPICALAIRETPRAPLADNNTRRRPATSRFKVGGLATHVKNGGSVSMHVTEMTIDSAFAEEIRRIAERRLFLLRGLDSPTEQPVGYPAFA